MDEKGLKHRRQKYRKSWEQEPEFRKWLTPVEGNVYKAACLLCKREFLAEKTVLKLHAGSYKHRKKLGENAKVIEVNYDSDDDGNQCIGELPTEVIQEQVEEYYSTPLKKRKFMKNHTVNNLLEQNKSWTDLPRKDSVRQRLLLQQQHRSNLPRQDEYSVYGEHVANNLRLSGRSRTEVVIAQHYIDQICFKLAMGTFSQKPFLNVVTISPKTGEILPSENAPSKPSPSKSPPQSSSAYFTSFCDEAAEPECEIVVVDA